MVRVGRSHQPSPPMASMVPKRPSQPVEHVAVPERGVVPQVAAPVEEPIRVAHVAQPQRFGLGHLIPLFRGLVVENGIPLWSRPGQRPFRCGERQTAGVCGYHRWRSFSPSSLPGRRLRAARVRPRRRTGHALQRSSTPAKKAAGKLKCYAGAIKVARAVDLACLLKVETKFDAAFVKAEAKGGCVKSGDTDAVERDVDAGVATIVTGEPGSPESQWVPLVARSWTMPAGSEGFRCRRIRVQSDMYVTGIRAASPPGVFSMIVSVSSSTSSPIGDYNCSPNQLDQRVIYESGIGTDDLEFPLGVGVHLHAGDYVNLNVHLDNGGTKDADGIAGVLARTGPPSSVINDAALVLAGTFNINIPNDGVPHTANGGCQWHSDNQLFALWPHLHARGTHASLLMPRPHNHRSRRRSSTRRTRSIRS